MAIVCYIPSVLVTVQCRFGCDIGTRANDGTGGSQTEFDFDSQGGAPYTRLDRSCAGSQVTVCAGPISE
ncbi:hypothetical protein [Haloprofundus salinisoli]|uniref:hypothetical protein n=1 Tax=Haloprofundus salinisoli TaxID=2876193 RepID=UPI001CCD6B4A|nr:hypothetical protein [Haloprofundus salinisoli]